MERERATLLDFPGFGPASIPDAVEELSRSAFAVWAWLCCQSPETLKTGRSQLAKSFGLTTKQFNHIMRELALKGYISFIPHGPYRPTTVTIERRMVVRLGGSIIRAAVVLLTHVLLGNYDA